MTPVTPVSGAKSVSAWQKVKEDSYAATSDHSHFGKARRVLDRLHDKMQSNHNSAKDIQELAAASR